MDRVGLVGVDGLIYVGVYDVMFMVCFFDMVVMVLMDEVELCYMVVIFLVIDDRFFCFRYFRGAGVGVNMENESVKVFNLGYKGMVLDIGKG